MSNLVNGLIQGANLEQSIRSSHQRERLLDAQNERANVASERAAESHKLSMERGRAGLAALADEQAHRKNLRPHEISAAERQAKAAGIALEQGQFNLDKSKALWKKALQNDDMAKRKQYAGLLYPQVIKSLVDSKGDLNVVYNEYPEYFELTRDMPNEFNLAYLFDPNQRQKVRSAVDIFNPKTPSSLQQPESLDLLNDVLQDQINAGEGVNPQTGKPITNKRVAGIYAVPNQPGKVALGLEVTDSDGNTYQAPRTNNLSTDDNDTVKMVDANQVMGLINAKLKMANAGEQITQLNPSAMQQLGQIYQRLQGSPSKELKAGYVPYGNGSVKFDELISLYKSQLPDQQTDANGYFLATQAMPFNHFRWAAGNDQKMEFVQRAYRHNLHIARTLQERLQELGEGDAVEAEQMIAQMQQAFMNPQLEYAAATEQAKQQGGKGAKQQKGIEAKQQGGHKVEPQGRNALAEPVYKQPMSLEDYELQHQAKKTQRSGMTPLYRSGDGMSLDQQYERYLSQLNAENEDIRLDHERRVRAQRQQQINLLTKKLELGRISDDEKLTLKSLLQQQQAGQ